MLNVMRITMVTGFTIATTIVGFAVGEPALGLLALLASVLFLNADWSRS
jgi:hypothetical protein